MTTRVTRNAVTVCLLATTITGCAAQDISGHSDAFSDAHSASESTASAQTASGDTSYAILTRVTDGDTVRAYMLTASEASIMDSPEDARRVAAHRPLTICARSPGLAPFSPSQPILRPLPPTTTAVLSATFPPPVVTFPVPCSTPAMHRPIRRSPRKPRYVWTTTSTRNMSHTRLAPVPGASTEPSPRRYRAPEHSPAPKPITMWPHQSVLTNLPLHTTAPQAAHTVRPGAQPISHIPPPRGCSPCKHPEDSP